jgi:hypothetical protein
MQTNLSETKPGIAPSKTKIQNDEDAPRLHLLGQDPLAKTKGEGSYLPEWPTSDAFWEEHTLEDSGTGGIALTIASDPKKDLETLQSSSSNPDESLARLEFILQTSNPTLEWWEMGNKSAPLFPSDQSGEKIGASYNVALRIIRALCETQGLWCAALPDKQASELWRTNKRLPEAWRTAPESLREKVALPRDIKVILEEPIGEWGPSPEFDCRLQGFKRIGVEVLGKTYILDPSVPFCAVSLDEWGVRQNTGNQLEGCANQAFIDLVVENSPEEADKRFLEAMKDAHIYQGQDEDSCYRDTEDFLVDYPGRISLLFHRDVAIAEEVCFQTERIEKAAACIMGSMAPEVAQEILQARRKKSTHLHIKTISLGPKGLRLEASFQNKTETRRFLVEPGQPPQVTMTPRGKKKEQEIPCQEKKKDPESGQQENKPETSQA